MNNQKMSYDVNVKGTLLSMPSELHMGMKSGQFVMQGIMQTSQMDLEKIMALIDAEVAEKYGTYLKSFTRGFPKELSFYYEGQQCMIGIRSEDQQWGVMWKDKDIAVLYALESYKTAEKGSIEYHVTMVKNALGIKKLFLYIKKGTSCNTAALTNYVMGCRETLQIPDKLPAYNLLFCGIFSFDKGTLVGQAMESLFGIGNAMLHLFLVASEQECTGLARLPTFTCGVLQARDLYVGVGVKNQAMQMYLTGTFLFSFLEGVQFQVECELNNQGFRIEAYAKMEQPKPLFHTFSIGDTCLAIGYQSGLVFQMFCNLYMGKIKLFGALGLSVKGSVTMIDLLSAAVTDITLSVFVESLLGKKINGLETCDFMELLGFPFEQEQKILMQENMSHEQVAEEFNKCIADKTFALDAAQVETEAFGEGLIIIDKKRMRHYYLTRDGTLQLQAQFYYAVKDMELGDYTISQGIFMCCTIRLFQTVEMQALFSMSDKDGVLAYACIKNFDWGFLKLIGSGLSDDAENPLAKLPEKSLLRQFVSPDEKGAVFYLRSGPNETSFYIDGRLELLDIFQFAAKLLYVKGMFSIDTRFTLFAGIETSLHLSVAYSDFQQANFSFELELDCTGLEKKLEKVQDKINNAIQILKNKIDSAKKKLTEAQNRVDELYGQIAGFDHKIDDCKYAITHAKWYEKAFVAIAKGIEIAAYEVAKAGLYAAIGIANAALEVAKQAVSLGGVVGEGVLQAINGAISATLNLFFVRYIKLKVSADPSVNYAEASIEFVALGKTYHYSTNIDMKEIQTDMVQALSNNMNREIEGDLKNMENGSFRSPRKQYCYEKYELEDSKVQLKEGMQQLQSATRLMCRMQNVYVDGCGQAMPGFEAINVSYQHAVHEIAGMLDLANRSVDYENMDEAVSLLEEGMSANDDLSSDATYQSVKKAITDYRKSAELLELVQQSIGVVNEQSQAVRTHMQTMKQNEERYQTSFVENGTIPDADMLDIINQTEEMIYEEFPDAGTESVYINLSKETRIHQYLDEARAKVAGEPTEKIKTMRARVKNGIYKNRL